MNRRTLLAALAAMPLMQMPMMASAQDQTLIEVSKYLNQLRSVQGRFSQTNADGSRASGVYFLRRPGFLRFEYDGNQALVITDGVNVGIFDSKSNSGAQKYPLGTTPLRLLLRRDIDLTAPGVARGVENDGTHTQVVLQDPNKPRDGSMTLVFSNQPAALVGWIVVDASGQRTNVELQTLEPVPTLDRQLFNIEMTELRRNGG